MPYSELPPDLRDFGHELMPAEELAPNTKCLTLMGTAGDLPQWNDRQCLAPSIGRFHCRAHKLSNTFR